MSLSIAAKRLSHFASSARTSIQAFKALSSGQTSYRITQQAAFDTRVKQAEAPKQAERKAMAPGLVEDAMQTNDPPTQASGILKGSEATKSHWTPQTVLSTLSQQPKTQTSSPVPFFHLLERLKTTKREGWRRFGINHGESISDHMYRMSIMTLACPVSLSSRLDVPRCTRMALIHDMAEALVGDITPVDGVAKPEKNRREAETMDYICTELLGKVGGGLSGKEIRAVWQEYEDNVTLEAKFVHDVDKMELLLQMLEYERAHEARIDLSEFSWVAEKIELDEIKAWSRELLEDRGRFWKEVGKVPHSNPV